MSVYFSSPGAPRRAPVFLLDLFSTKDVSQVQLYQNLNFANFTSEMKMKTTGEMVTSAVTLKVHINNITVTAVPVIQLIKIRHFPFFNPLN